MPRRKKETSRSIVDTLRHYYELDEPEAHRFRFALLAFDLATLLFIVVTSFMPGHALVEWVDIALGLIILADILARFSISQRRLRELLHPATWADIAAVVSFLAPLTGEAVGFLRILRTVRLLHSYQLLKRLRHDSPWFRRQEEVVLATVNLAVFVFITTGFVYETQRAINTEIRNYGDALYFTVTALTTTGFGDITLKGAGGRIISVVVMILGVTLFFNLARAILQPAKVRFQCPDCGLRRHDPDAVHCKACGTLLNLPDDG